MLGALSIHDYYDYYLQCFLFPLKKYFLYIYLFLLERDLDV